MAWEFTGDRPIYAQLTDRLQRRLVTGEYAPGARLPSVRELAAEAAVNPNTMQRALAELEDQGLVCSQRTAGRFVTEDAARIAALRESMAGALIRDFLHRMQELGFTPRAAATLLKEREEETI